MFIPGYESCSFRTKKVINYGLGLVNVGQLGSLVLGLVVKYYGAYCGLLASIALTLKTT